MAEPTTYVLVGGHSDGKRAPCPDDRDCILMPSEGHSLRAVRAEMYRRVEFRDEYDRPIYCFALENMGAGDVLKRLISGYPDKNADGIPYAQNDRELLPLSNRIDLEELEIAANNLEDRGWTDSAEVLRNAHANVTKIRGEAKRSKPVLPMFNLAAIEHGLGENLTGYAERQARVLARHLEAWLRQYGVTRDNAGDYNLERTESIYEQSFVYRLLRLNGDLVSELRLERDRFTMARTS